MTVDRPVIKHLAAVIAFVMVTGVALPAVAHACGLNLVQVFVTATCCQAGEDGAHGPIPCHGDVPTLPAKCAAEAVCCTASALTAAPEAALTKEGGVPVASSALLAPGLWPANAESTRPVRPPDRKMSTGAGAGLGFYVLYGALLN